MKLSHNNGGTVVIEITIFTPTYNRLDKLKRCYKSLVCQTSMNFKWLVIDDGSTDNTGKWISAVKSCSKFEIIYIYQKNGGKHRAHNTAVNECDTEFFLILDSDDYLEINCIEVLENYAKKIKNMDRISGILGNRFDALSKKCIGNKIPQIEYASGLELYQKYNFKGDTLRLYKTSILKQYLFPDIPSEKFVWENVVFDKIDKKYQFYLIQDQLYYGEYLSDGYTANISKIKRDNPVGYGISLKSSADTAVTLKKKIGLTILTVLWCEKNDKCKNYIKYDNFFYILLFPIAKIFELIKYPKFFFEIFEEE